MAGEQCNTMSILRSRSCTPHHFDRKFQHGCLYWIYVLILVLNRDSIWNILIFLNSLPPYKTSRASRIWDSLDDFQSHFNSLHWGLKVASILFWCFFHSKYVVMIIPQIYHISAFVISTSWHFVLEIWMCMNDNFLLHI